MAVEGEELLGRAFVGGEDAAVGDLFAASDVALAREGVRVLNVEVMSAGGFRPVLVGGDAGHDVGGSDLLCAGFNCDEGKDEDCRHAHGLEYGQAREEVPRVMVDAAGLEAFQFRCFEGLPRMG